MASPSKVVMGSLLAVIIDSQGLATRVSGIAALLQGAEYNPAIIVIICLSQIKISLSFGRALLFHPL